MFLDFTPIRHTGGQWSIRVLLIYEAGRATFDTGPCDAYEDALALALAWAQRRMLAEHAFQTLARDEDWFPK